MTHKTRRIYVGGVAVGGGAPVSVQSMCSTDTRDVAATLRQIHALAEAGCEIVRCAVPDREAAEALRAIRAACPLPLIADIHFDSRLAVQAVEAGVKGLRINPGNIGGADKVDRVVDAARAAGVPIRIGVNSGSVDKDLLKKHGGPTPAAMVESALEHVRLLEERKFGDIKISLKSSSVLGTVAAYRLMAKTVDYPLHIGVTEAGTAMRGAVKSSVGLGILLAEGIGDTLRVSLTADPVEEVKVAKQILQAMELGQGLNIISCPSCSRVQNEAFVELAEQVRELTAYARDHHLTIAVMGCRVNGPGETDDADLGLWCGPKQVNFKRRGELVGSFGYDEILPRLKTELDALIAEGA